MKYTFHSTDPDNFNEIYCPIIYRGVCRRVRWWVNELTSIQNIIVLDTTDYITFYLEGDEYLDSPAEGGTITWNLSSQYTSISSSLMTEFNNSGKTDLTLSKTDLGMYKFSTVMGYFEIKSMSYNMKQALGFYYVSDNETIKTEIASTSESGKSNWV